MTCRPALELCRSAGWNQLHSDWVRLVEYQGNGCFVADVDGSLAGTVTTTSYGKRLAWIGMMLVHPEFRRRGIATALMESSIAYLQQCGTECIKLDATPEGQLVYEQLGFRPEWSFHRWKRDPLGSSDSQSDDRVLDRWSSDAIASIDLRAFDADRKRYLDRLAEDSVCCRHPGGFGMLREGFLASYVGPVVATSTDSARQIMSELLARAPATIFWDVPGPNEDAIELARQFGFQPVRDLTRMHLGPLNHPQINLQYAMSDPGTG